MSIGKRTIRFHACIVSQNVLVPSPFTPRNEVHTITSPLRRSLHTKSLALDCQRVSSGSSPEAVRFLHPLGPLPSNKPTLILASPGIAVALRLALFYTVTWFTDCSLELARLRRTFPVLGWPAARDLLKRHGAPDKCASGLDTRLLPVSLLETPQVRSPN